MSNKLLEFTVFIATGNELDCLSQYAVHIKAPSPHAAYMAACERLEKEESFRWAVAAHVVFDGFLKPKSDKVFGKHVKLLDFKEKARKELQIRKK